MSTESATGGYGPYVPPVLTTRRQHGAKAAEEKPSEPAAPADGTPGEAPQAGPAPAAAPAGPYVPPPLLDEEMFALLGPYVPPSGLGTGGHGRYIPPKTSGGIGNAPHAGHARSSVPGQVAPPPAAPVETAPAVPAETSAAPAIPAAEIPSSPAHEAQAPSHPSLQDAGQSPAPAAFATPAAQDVPGDSAAAPSSPTAPAVEAVPEAQPLQAPAPAQEPAYSGTPNHPGPQAYPGTPEYPATPAGPNLSDPAVLWEMWIAAHPQEAAQWAEWSATQPGPAAQWAKSQVEQIAQWLHWAGTNPEEAARWAEANPQQAAQWALAYPSPAGPAATSLPAAAPTVPAAPARPTGSARPVSNASAPGVPVAGSPSAAGPHPRTAPRTPSEQAAPPETRGGYRGGVFDQLDVPAATSFLVCALLFVIAIVWVKSVDYSSLDRPTLEDVPERIAKILMPLRPPGKPAAKPPAERKPGNGPKGAPAAPGKSDASAAARIERSRRTVTEKVEETQQRVKRVAMLSILTGKGPATGGTTTASRARNRAGGLVDFGGLEDKLANLEGLTKFDSKSTVNNGAKAREDVAADLAGIDKMVKGFQNAKVSTLAKVGVMELEKPELLERNSRYTGDRSMADVGSFISKKQSLVSMLYEERLKIDPTLEGKITVVLVIEEDGTVSSATVLRSETTLNDLDFQAELLRRIKRWIFPPSTGGPVEMKSPFVFKPA